MFMLDIQNLDLCKFNYYVMQTEFRVFHIKHTLKVYVCDANFEIVS